MKTKPYQLIIVLLSISLSGVLLLQGFWMQRFYAQKEKEFKAQAHAVLARVSDKLNERENLQVIKHNFNTDSTINKTSSRTHIIVSSSSSFNSSEFPPPPLSPKTKLPDESIHFNSRILVFDSVFETKSTGTQIDLDKRTGAWTTKKEEIKELLDKMKDEIEVLESSSLDEISEKQLSELLKKELEQSGMSTPFEFSLKKQTDKTEDILTQSKGFNVSETAFKTDLSAKRVFSNNHYLYLQFPEQNTIVFSGIKNMILLSLLFSFIIVGVFYYSITLIFKQKKLGEIKNDFINNMTHELKTPIATIFLATDAISNPLVRNSTEKFEEYTRILKEENAKLNAHVEKVLQMALMEKGELQLNKSETDLNTLVMACIRSFSLVLQKTGGNISHEFKNDSVYFNCDPFHFGNAINNLIDNALKYSEEAPQVQIRIEKTSNSIEINIKDKGIGIPPDKLNKVFDKFYRAQGGNLHDVKGFGLGLSYVRSIVEAHGGNITVKSEKGKGTEFNLLITQHA